MQIKKKEMDSAEKLQITHSTFYVSLGIFSLALVIQAIKIIYLIFIKNEKDLTKENTTIFVVFFIFLLFSIIVKVIAQKISSESSSEISGENSNEKPTVQKKSSK